MNARVTFDGLPYSDESYVGARAAKLEMLFGRIADCRIAIESPHGPERAGHHYRVCIHLSVEGEAIAITRAPDESIANEDAYVAVDGAFDDAGRRLEDFVRRRSTA